MICSVQKQKAIIRIKADDIRICFFLRLLRFHIYFKFDPIAESLFLDRPDLLTNGRSLAIDLNWIQNRKIKRGTPFNRWTYRNKEQDWTSRSRTTRQPAFKTLKINRTSNSSGGLPVLIVMKYNARNGTLYPLDRNNVSPDITYGA